MLLARPALDIFFLGEELLERVLGDDRCHWLHSQLWNRHSRNPRLGLGLGLGLRLGAGELVRRDVRGGQQETLSEVSSA